MNTPSSDVIIIGGGVIGWSIAYFLRQSNISVTVCDTSGVPVQASHAAAGLLAPLGSLPGVGPLADLLLASYHLFPTLVAELEEKTGLAIDYQQTGALRVARNVKRVERLHKRMQAWQPLGLQLHQLNGDEARQREPLLSADIAAAVYAPEEAQLRASALTNAFTQAAQHAGAVAIRRRVVGVQHEQKRVTGVLLDDGQQLPCGHVVIAAGAWSAVCGEWLHISIPVTPQRGQILALQQTEPPLQHMIFGEAVYLAPKADNTIVVGATKEDVGFDAQTTDEGLKWLVESAVKLVPQLKQSPLVASWAGLRPSTPDARPILGPVSGWENVMLATGHNSIGIMLSAITGKTIAETIVTGRVAEVIRLFGMERFEHKLKG